MTHRPRPPPFPSIPWNLDANVVVGVGAVGGEAVWEWGQRVDAPRIAVVHRPLRVGAAKNLALQHARGVLVDRVVLVAAVDSTVVNGSFLRGVAKAIWLAGYEVACVLSMGSGLGAMGEQRAWSAVLAVEAKAAKSVLLVPDAGVHMSTAENRAVCAEWLTRTLGELVR